METNNEYSVEELNQIKKEANEAIELSKCLERLNLNDDFKKLFLENYVKNEAVRLVGLLGDPTINISKEKEAYREEFKERMVGIARFNEYMRFIFANADRAKKTLEDIVSIE